MDTTVIVSQEEKETVHILGTLKESFVVKHILCEHKVFCRQHNLNNLLVQTYNDTHVPFCDTDFIKSIGKLCK